MQQAELHAQQIEVWNGDVGAYWVVQQQRLDKVLQPVAAATLVLAAPQSGERVLDIGCGCGATTLMLADAVGTGGMVTGLDISAPMLGRARERSMGRGQIDWILADASSHEFTPGAFDLLFSRFGVMFFGDPVAAFRNLLTGMRKGGRLVFCCWRSLSENPWMQLPLQAALEHVPPPPRPGPDDPGPFSFASQDRIRWILAHSGFAAPKFTPLEVTIDLANGEGIEAAVQQATASGAARRVLEGQPESVRSAAADSIRVALMQHARGDNVDLPGAAWLVLSERPH